MATLYPVLRQAGMSLLSAAAVIATTATIMPTPLGSDNVAIAAELAKTDMFSGLTASDYVFRYHVLVSIPTLLVMALAHYFWQKFMDKRAGSDLTDGDVDLAEVKAVEGSALYRTVYAILPLLPIVMLLIVFVITSTTGAKIDLSVELASILSFVIAIICELIRTRKGKETLAGTESFFKGMGGAMPIVALLVAASVFVVAYPCRPHCAHRATLRFRYRTVLRDGSAHGSAGRCCWYQCARCVHPDGSRWQSAARCLAGLRCGDDRRRLHQEEPNRHCAPYQCADDRWRNRHVHPVHGNLPADGCVMLI